jgi:hypothetical protein
MIFTPAPNFIRGAIAVGGLLDSIEEQVDGVLYMGNRTIAEIDLLPVPANGICAVATSAGTPAAAGSAALAIGDVAEYRGAVTGWQVLVANVGGTPPPGTRLLAAPLALAPVFAPLTAADYSTIATFAGGTLTPTLDTPATHAVVAVRTGIRADRLYMLLGPAATGVWTSVTVISGDDGHGLQFDATGVLNVLVTDLDGDGLTDDGGGATAQLEVDPADASLTVGAGGVAVQLDDDSIVTGAGGISVQLDDTARTAGDNANNPIVTTAAKGLNVATDTTTIDLDGSGAISALVGESAAVTGSNNADTTSLTHVLIQGAGASEQMAITPVAGGTYLATLSTQTEVTGPAEDIEIAIYANGVLATNSEIRRRIPTATDLGAVSTQARVTIAGSQTIDGRFLSAGGNTVRITKRTLTIVRVS